MKRLLTIALVAVIVGSVNLLFTIVAIWTVDRLGRKPLMIVGSLVMGLCLVAMGLAKLRGEGDRGVLPWLLIGGGIFGLMATFGLGQSVFANGTALEPAAFVGLEAAWQFPWSPARRRADVGDAHGKEYGDGEQVTRLYVGGIAGGHRHHRLADGAAVPGRQRREELGQQGAGRRGAGR